MRPEQLSLLLIAALVIWYVQTRATAEQQITICPHCGDLVAHPAGWVRRCPSCRTLLIG